MTREKTNNPLKLEHTDEEELQKAMLCLSYWQFRPWINLKVQVQSLLPLFDADRRFHGVMVSTLDSESSDPSSNLGGTWF